MKSFLSRIVKRLEGCARPAESERLHEAEEQTKRLWARLEALGVDVQVIRRTEHEPGASPHL